MEYLNKILGIEVVYENVALTHLPNFIATRYRLQLVSMNGQRAIFLYPATELEQIEVLKKHIARIQKKMLFCCGLIKISSACRNDMINIGGI